MDNSSNRNGYIAEINVSAMVGIVLVLLSAFMITSPNGCSGESVVLPKSINSVEDQNINKETAVIIAIPADGQFYVGKEVIAKERLTEKVKAMMENRKIQDRVVYIKGGSMISYGSIVDTLSALRNARITRIGLITRKDVKHL